MDSAEAVLRAFVEWFEKVDDDTLEDDSPAGTNYLNGDSDKYPGDAWDDFERIVERAKRLLD